MRLLGRLLAAMVLVLIGWWLLQTAPLTRWLATANVSGLPVELLEDARRSSAYAVPREQWLTFSLLPGGGRLRLLANAQLPLEAVDLEIPEPVKWTYTLHYRVLDAEDRVLSSETLQLESVIGVIEQADGGRLRTLYQAPGGAAVTEGRLVYLAEPADSADRIQLRLAPLTAPVRGVIARLYQREQIPEHQLRYQWQRLSSADKARLGEASVHGHARLSDRERRALLRQRWQPLAPSGVEGRDYRRITLYQVGSKAGAPVKTPVPPAGRLAGPRHDFVLPIPDPGGQVRLQLTPVSSDTATDPAAPPVELSWIGRPATRQARWQHPLDSAFVAELKPGLLVMRTTEPLAVRAWLTPSGASEAQEITPERTYLRAWELGPGLPVQYRVAHIGTTPTPWRLDLRRLQRPEPLPSSAESPSTEQPAQATPGPVSAATQSPRSATLETAPAADDGSMPFEVRYQWLDDSGGVLNQGVLSGAPPASRLDWLPREPEARVSDVETFYFQLPTQVSTLVLSSDETMVASASTRPPGSPRRMILPEPSREPSLEPAFESPPDPAAEATAAMEQAADPATPLPRPDWFLLRPPDWAERRRSGASALLIRQPSPAEVDPQLLSGDFRFESFQPDGRWRGRYLLLPASDSTLRTEALASRFIRLTPNQTQQLRFASRTLPLEPELLYLNESGAGATLSLRLDRQPVLSRTLRSESGLLTLPPMAPGRYAVELQSSAGVRALISNTEEAFESGRQAWSRRLGVRLDANGLSIPFRKPQDAEEILSLRWFGLVGGERAQHLQAQLLGADQEPLQRPRWGPFRDWTILENELWLGPMPDGPARVLQAPDEQVEDVLLAFIPLGSDLAAGDYRLQIDLEQGRGGYLMLTLTEPGDYSWARFRREP